VWIPLAARLTRVNASANRMAPLLIEELPEEARFVLGDTHYNARTVSEACLTGERFLVASGRRSPSSHTYAGVKVWRILHRLRYIAIENLNEHFKALFDAHGPVPTRGRLETARFALGTVFVYQLALLHHHEQDSGTNRGEEQHCGPGGTPLLASLSRAKPLELSITTLLIVPLGFYASGKVGYKPPHVGHKPP
jgi:hypothetical protein